MAKAIFITFLPKELADKLKDIQEMLEKKMPDYYPLLVLHDKDQIEFQAFYEKDFDDIKYEELKDIVIKSVGS